MAGGKKIFAVVKADAYGHSVSLTVPVLDNLGADGFAVSNIDEALCVRRLSSKPILILGYSPVSAVKYLAENNISQTVYSLEFAELLNNEAERLGVRIKAHYKIDSGMGRLGFDFRDKNFEEKNELIKSASLKNLICEGIFTHFSVADGKSESDISFTETQYENFCEAVKYLKESGFEPEYIHCNNSAGIIGLKSDITNTCRAGIILYGLLPDGDYESPYGFTPVMEFKSTVSFVKKVKKGTSIGYGRTFVADRDMTVATVAVGYADGYMRALSGKGYCLINGQKADIIGNICMDQMTVDVSGIKGVKDGDEVLLFGKKLPVEILAEKIGTINYELVCAVSKRVPRI